MHGQPELKANPIRFRPRIAISMGDFNGIGPEIALKCLSDSRFLRYLRPTLIGSLDIFQSQADRLGLSQMSLQLAETVADSDNSAVIPVVDVSDGLKHEVQFGQLSADAGRLAMIAVERAVDLCLAGDSDAVVTAPISKDAISRAGYDVPGHTEFVAHQCGAAGHTMMMVSGDIRIGLVTGHVPIWNVPDMITEETILEKLEIISSSLILDFGIQRPRIAVLGLNPHAGEAGIMGKEEEEVIIPAVSEAKKNGIHAYGPYPADGFFGTASYRNYDAVLAMYHDQGLVPFKTLAFESGVNYTAGLPIVRTSPDHGTAFDIAGQGVAVPTSMRSAIYLALEIARRRLNVD